MRCIKCAQEFANDLEACPNCGTKVLRLDNHSISSPFDSVHDAAAKKTPETVARIREEQLARLNPTPEPEPEPEKINPFTHNPFNTAPAKPQKKGFFSIFKK